MGNKMINILNLTQDFLNSNVGVVTFLVGFLAIYLYIKQRIDKKRDAARLILQEIRYAEQQIRNSGRGARGYSLASKLLPTNSWNDNIHLFIKNLKETQIDMISEFYSKATYIDYLITERSNQKIHPKIVKQVQSGSNQQGSATGQYDEVQALPTPQQIMQIVQIPTPDESITIQLLTEVSSSIEFLYNTPAVEKLRQISEPKWYCLI